MIDLSTFQRFDRAPIMRMVDTLRRQAMSKAGAYVRQRARSLIRKARQKTLAEMTPAERAAYKIAVQKAIAESRPKPRRPDAVSKPGEPPRTHGQSRFRNTIQFGFDTRRESVVIGPVLTRSRGSRPVPSLLEHGGTATRRGRTRRYRARPFMGPALEAEAPNFAYLFRR